MNNKDILLPIGSIVELYNRDNEIIRYMIIGKRIISNESLKPWDYISVPFETGMERIIRNGGGHNENFFYFNHYEIHKIVRRYKAPKLEQVSNQ